jgi:hypothetical protein
VSDASLIARIRAARDDDTWRYHSRLSVRFRYVAVAVPKVGCTTIKRTLHELEGLPPEDREYYDHEGGQGMRLSRFAPEVVADAFTSDDWVRFTFVRNPYDRLLSAWKSKIQNPGDSDNAQLRTMIREAFGYPSLADDPPVAFGDFARFVTSTSDPSVARDGHWDRQVTVGRHDLIPYTVIGRFESFVDDLAEILRRIGAPAAAFRVASEITNQTAPLSSAEAYDSELARIVYEHYRDDFETFGYDRGSWAAPRLDR